MSKYLLNGKEVTREEFLAGANNTDWLRIPARTKSPATFQEHNPLISESMGVLPRQVKRERENLREFQDRGELTGVRILDNGAVALTDRGEQGRIGWMRYRGDKVDEDGSYGDVYTPDQRFDKD